MGKNQLGFPLTYSKLYKYYDLLSASQDEIDRKNHFIDRILSQHKVKTVLDFTCGTGAQLFGLTTLGYQVTGVDLSPFLLKIAREKSQQKKLGVELIEGDVRETQVGSFDAAITIFNAIGHLTKTDFEKGIRNIHENLVIGGVYVFDIFNLNAMTDDAIKNLAMDVKVITGDTKIYHSQNSEIDRENGRLTSYDCFTIEKECNEPKVLKDKFTLQIYTARELRRILIRNGFEVLGQYELNGSKLSEQETVNMLTVAKKS
ncbi:MAG: class I SAM-dependent methyltransferase [Candidatus Poribacteria bacterium]|nr:class I SAM-dependent methyltransferase [Candidatus Poribacteria bacterium]|tara:strand:- start:1223 stop:1999 length:777 start_codon:yes stop_codon:yes gene_type:complete